MSEGVVGRRDIRWTWSSETYSNRVYTESTTKNIVLDKSEDDSGRKGLSDLPRVRDDSFECRKSSNGFCCQCINPYDRTCRVQSVFPVSSTTGNMVYTRDCP